MATEYGARLKLARKHAKLTQQGLAKKTGIPQSTIATAEGKGHGSSDTPIYANACGVDVTWLATGEGTMVAGTSALARDAARLIDSITDEDQKRRVYAMLVQMVEFGATVERGAKPEQQATPEPSKTQ